MDVTSPEKLLLGVLFIIPGFVGMKLYSILVSGARLDASKAIVDAVAFSCFNYAIFAFPIYLMQAHDWQHQMPVFYAIVWAIIILVGPMLCAVGFVVLRRSKFVASWLPHPIDRAWDYVFAQRQMYYLIITLSSGKRIGGAYSYRSFASSYPADADIFIEQVWDVDEEEGFVRRHENTCGLWVAGSNIESIEFIEIHDDYEQDSETDDGPSNSERRVSTDNAERLSTDIKDGQRWSGLPASEGQSAATPAS